MTKRKMRKRRIFVAINLPVDLKRKLLAWQDKQRNLPVRWVGEDNLHLTLVFIGDIRDEELVEICRLVKEVIEKHPPFLIRLKQISFGPQRDRPRLVWLRGEKVKNLAQIKDDLEEAFLNSNENLASREPSDPSGLKSGYRIKDRRGILPHITLGRIIQREWRNLNEKPKIEVSVEGKFLVRTVEVMESELRREGAKYSILESVELKGLS